MPSPGDLPDAGVKPQSAAFQADSLSSEPPGKPIGFTQSSFLLRNLYAGQDATVRTGQGTTDWFQIRKGVRQGYILSPCLFNLYADYII